MNRSILVATDGSEGGIGALRLAHNLASRDGSRVEVLSVYRPAYIATPGEPDVASSMASHFTRAAVEARRARIRAQLRSLGPAVADEVTVEVGRVATTISRVAAERGSDLIVVGLGAAGGIEGWRSRERLLRLIHLVEVPVVAVPSTRGGLPREAVVGMDFSDFSVRAAREVIRELGVGAHLHLVHVVTEVPLPSELLPPAGRIETLRRAAEDKMAEMASGLAGGEAVDVEGHVRIGDAAEELLKVAEEVDADLVAIGSHGTGFVGRTLIGSVSSAVTHHVHCALLVAPPRSSVMLDIDLTESELLADLERARQG